MKSNEDYADYVLEEDAYYKSMYKLPKYKTISRNEQDSKASIDWHTYTIYPQQLMDKYKYKIPKGKLWFRITPYSWSTQLWITLVVNADMTVTVKENYRFYYTGNGSVN